MRQGTRRAGAVAGIPNVDPGFATSSLVPLSLPTLCSVQKLRRPRLPTNFKTCVLLARVPLQGVLEEGGTVTPSTEQALNARHQGPQGLAATLASGLCNARRWQRQTT